MYVLDSITFKTYNNFCTSWNASFKFTIPWFNVYASNYHICSHRGYINSFNQIIPYLYQDYGISISHNHSFFPGTSIFGYLNISNLKIIWYLKLIKQNNLMYKISTVQICNFILYCKIHIKTRRSLEVKYASRTYLCLAHQKCASRFLVFQ